MSSRRELGLTAVLVGAGALLALFSSGRAPAPAGAGGQLTDHASAARALALVALAGLGIVLFAGGWARVVVGVVIALTGLGIMITAPGWLSTVGGLAVATGGTLAAWRGRRWVRSGSSEEQSHASARDAWDALDRGEDPTA